MCDWALFPPVVVVSNYTETKYSLVTHVWSALCSLCFEQQPFIGTRGGAVNTFFFFLQRIKIDKNGSEEGLSKRESEWATNRSETRKCLKQTLA